MPLSGGDSPYPPLPRFPKNPFFRIRRARKKSKWGSFPNKTKGGGSPHLHSHSMEELLLNPHYNQSKFSPDRYMMLNRDRDRERGLPLCWLFETKALIGMVLIPMFLLVSFGFESLPLPVPYSSFESRYHGFFFPYAGESASPFYINYYQNFLGSL